MIVTGKSRVSSYVPVAASSFQSVITSGVPTIWLFSSSYVKPDGRPVTSSVVSLSSVIVTGIGVISCPSVTVASDASTVGAVVSATFGLLSSVSGIPSLSSSVSVTSGFPSPSVSRCTVIMIVSSVTLPASSVTVIVTGKSRVSSYVPVAASSFQSVMLSGVPTIWLFASSYVKPDGRPVTSSVVFVLSVIVTGIGVISCPSVTVASDASTVGNVVSTTEIVNVSVVIPPFASVAVTVIS